MNTNVNIAIHGMGRIGRCLFRLLHQQNKLHFLAVACDTMTKENLIYLLRYDSIRGPFDAEIVSTEKGFRIGEHEVTYEQSHSGVPLWRDHQIDLVVEATGHFTQMAEASVHLTNGAKQVLLTTYSKDIPSFIWGVNHQSLSKNAPMVSPGDCTVNSVAPVLSKIQEAFGIESVHVNVIQAYTTRQELLDKPYKGWRRGRAAAHAIIPFEVNITPVLENLFPDLTGRIETMSTRVPIPCGAFAELSCMLKSKASADQVNEIFSASVNKDLEKITTITFDPVVSADIMGNIHSGVIDGLLTRVTHQHHLRLMVWFDNEWGYTNRLLDWIKFLSTRN